MTVAFDIGRFRIFCDGELYYPGVATLLSILSCGGDVIVFDSCGAVSERDRQVIDKLGRSFGGRISFAADGSGADMAVS